MMANVHVHIFTNMYFTVLNIIVGFLYHRKIWQCPNWCCIDAPIMTSNSIEILKLREIYYLAIKTKK